MLFAPAMNDKMWGNPAVQENIKFAKKIGVKIVGPNQGRLACGSEGIGRMAEPQEILEAVEKIAAGLKHKRK
jgi:phosphopantothenoylcysteine decarboxylase/phosphopantothenate--cysteine ligase